MYFLTKCQFLSWRTVLLNFHFHLIFFLNYRTFLFYLLLLQINILTTFTFLLNALSKQMFFLRELSKQFSTLYCTLDAAFLLSGGIYCTVFVVEDQPVYCTLYSALVNTWTVADPSGLGSTSVAYSQLQGLSFRGSGDILCFQRRNLS